MRVFEYPFPHKIAILNRSPALSSGSFGPRSGNRSSPVRDVIFIVNHQICFQPQWGGIKPSGQCYCGLGDPHAL
jgi:hypothetical protein